MQVTIIDQPNWSPVFVVTHNRKRYEYKMHTNGWMCPITGQVVATAQFPVAKELTLGQFCNVCTMAAKQLLAHTQAHA